MKKFLDSIYFYPFIAVVTIFIGLFGFYFYAVDAAQKTIIRQQLQDKKEALFFFKSTIEELSMGKKEFYTTRDHSPCIVYVHPIRTAAGK